MIEPLLKVKENDFELIVYFMNHSFSLDNYSFEIEKIRIYVQLMIVFHCIITFLIILYYIILYYIPLIQIT
jgi:hypothetical protein